MVAMAGTTGSVEAYNENEATFVKGAKPTFVAKKTGVKTEVKVNGTGFSFGRDFKAEDLELGKVTKANYLNHSSVWAKYELPELTKGLNMYVKGTVSPKFANEDAATAATEPYKFDGSAELEGQVSYKYDVLTFGLNSKTNFPFKLSKDNDDYGKDVKSTHKVFVESEEGKDVFVKGLKDVKANLEIKHNYAKDVVKAGDRVDYVSGEASAKYDGVKDLELEGKVSFKRNIKSGEKIGNYEVLGTKLFREKEARYIHSYELKGTYKGVEHLTLSAKPFVAHANIKKDLREQIDNIIYGVELGAEYKMLNDKLTLTGKSLLAGDTSKVTYTTSEDIKEHFVLTRGHFVFDANVKYDYSVTDKFTVSPEATTRLTLNTSQGVLVGTELVLTPKVSAEYKPTDTLTLKGSVKTPVKFKTVGKEFKYTDTQIKTRLNLKYEWK